MVLSQWRNNKSRCFIEKLCSLGFVKPGFLCVKDTIKAKWFWQFPENIASGWKGKNGRSPTLTVKVLPTMRSRNGMEPSLLFLANMTSLFPYVHLYFMAIQYQDYLSTSQKALMWIHKAYKNIYQRSLQLNAWWQKQHLSLKGR